VGHIKNFETCLQRAQGSLVHLLHGDDYVLDGFYCARKQLCRGPGGGRVLLPVNPD
jgi:hypothetical protein